MRSGQYKKIVASSIKEGELKSYNPITEEIVFEPIMDPEVREKAKTVGYYAMFELMNGYRKEIYWPYAKMEAHASKYSQTYKSDKKYKSKKSIWSTNFDAMAEKTMIRTLIRKWGIMSVKNQQMQRAIEADMGVINDDGSVTYVDNQPDVVEEAHEAIEAGANTQEFMDVEFSEVPTADEVNADNPFAEG
jgi:recombination protein RecT